MHWWIIWSSASSINSRFRIRRRPDGRVNKSVSGTTMSTIVRNIGTTLEMIKIEHTLFALPFAFLGAVLSANGIPSARQILWITLAMVGARSTAMAFNRIADREY